MTRPRPLGQTLHELREGASAAADTAALAGHVVRAAQERIGISGASFFRIGGPVVSSEDFVTLSRAPAGRVAAVTSELMQRVDHEVLSFPALFASQPRSFDISRRFGEEFLRSTGVYNDYWRPWGVERQLLGPLGTTASPRGFVCVSRHAAERPFSADDLRVFEDIRAQVDRALAGPHSPSQRMEDALSALTATTDAVSLLFDPSGTLLWITGAACARLSLAAARLGSSFAIGRSPLLDALRAWVRARARDGESADLEVPPPLRAPGERLVVRRYDDHGRTRFLLTLEPAAAPLPSLSSARTRAAALGRERRLTPRQTDVLAQLATGQGNKAIATQLGCSEKTIELHVSALLSKLGCASRTELVARFWTR